MTDVRIINENLEEKYDNESTSVDNQLRELKNYKREQDILEVINMLNENPDLTEEMIRPDLKEVFRVAYREYKKQMIQETGRRLR